jgi:excisionase family DNA binding protein
MIVPTPQSSSDTLPLLLTAGQAGRYIGVSVRTLWRLVSAKQLPEPLHVGRAARWRRADLDAAITGWQPGDMIEVPKATPR